MTSTVSPIPKRVKRRAALPPGSREPEANVGQRLRALRLERHLTLRELADHSGLGLNTLSLIEHGRTSPSVSTLQQLAGALTVPITVFFEVDAPRRAVVVSQADQRARVSFAQGALEDLGAGISDPAVNPFLLKLDPGAESGPCTIVHTGQEFVYCLSGALLYTVAGQSYHLDPGDSLLFEAHLPHCWANALPDQPSLAILVLAPQDHRDRPVERHLALAPVRR
ncbi:MAG: cupin domain-containing protein [Anaerolineales bacterium]|nr:cupin domain-containing protein [Anaerolineales bacterium]